MSDYYKHGMGDTINLVFEIFRNNVGLTGQTPAVAVKNQDTEEWLTDTLDGWQVAYNDFSLTEVDSSNLAGIYSQEITHIDSTAVTYQCYFKNDDLENGGFDFESHRFTGEVYVPASSSFTSGTIRGSIRDMKNKDGFYTFNSATDSLEALSEKMFNIGGLMFENSVEDDIVRDARGNITSSSIYIYDSVTNANLHDKSTGLVTKYTTTIIYDDSGKFTSLKTVEV